ncbi:AMP-binding protein [Sphingomonas sp. ID0503]|uniref:AMP-binding protein n=1 Tax=Sphingomonas sp. ID0503 TaxID=3399691 RepID=UPI003AFAD03C
MTVTLMAPPTLLDFLSVNAVDDPDRPCVIFGEEVVSFFEMDCRSHRLATALQQRGVGPGDRVAIIGHTSIAFYELVFACAKLGAIMNPLNWRLSPREIAAIIADGAPKLIIVDPSLRHLLGEVVDVADTIDLGEPFVAWRDGARASGNLPVSDPEKPLLLLYTSGTTGVPKGVMLSQASVALNGRTAREAWSFTRDSVNLVAMPLFHVGGIGYGMMALSQGGTTVLLAQPDAASLKDVMTRHRVTHAFFVPSVILRLVEHLEESGSTLPSLELVIYGAAPISPTLLQRATAVLGCDFAHAYGMTETAGTVVTLLPKDHDPAGPHPERLSSCGQAVAWAQARIVDPTTGTDAEPGVTGELCIRSPMVMLGYWNREGATREALSEDGWLRTGDAAAFDGDRYIYLRGRYKDMIVSGGENIYPVEIENVMSAHPAVAEVAVIGVPHELWGETPRAFVVLRADFQASDSDLITFTRSMLARYKCPTSVIFKETLPKNASGKILKHELG